MSGLRPVFILPWLLYAAAMIWYPIHESVVARERVANADFAKCRQHAASVQAVRFCESDYGRDLADAREIQWERHPLWNPFWFAPLVLLLPPFAVYGLIWILTRGAA
jgi:hypothetical protein